MLTGREQALVQAALARGFLTPAQVGEAQQLHATLAAQGRSPGLLPLLGQRYLTPAQLNELRGLYSSGRLASAGFASDVTHAADTQAPDPRAALGFDDTQPDPAFAQGASQRWEPGARVAEWVLDEKIGQGGMGAVFLGRHATTGAPCAIKALSLGSSRVGQERFRREAAAMASVDRHPNVLRVHSAGEALGHMYLVMDLASGGDLSQRIEEQGPMELQAGAAMVGALARGLAHVHAQGILHRDLKPANILFDERGNPLLVDFGLARSEDWESLTKTGALVGTPAYASPEQVRGQRGAVSEQSDIYGLGAVLFQVLTGEAPFEGAGSMPMLIAQILNSEVEPPSKRRPGLDPAGDRVVQKALAKRPEDRYASAADFAEDLEQLARGESVEVWLPRKRMGKRALALVWLCGLGAVLAAAALWKLAAPAPKPAAKTIEPPPPAAPAPPKVVQILAAKGAELGATPMLGIRLFWLARSSARGILLQGHGVDQPRLMVPFAYRRGSFTIGSELVLELLEPTLRCGLWLVHEGSKMALGFSAHSGEQTGYRRTAPVIDVWVDDGESRKTVTSRRLALGKLRLALRWDQATQQLAVFLGEERLCGLDLPGGIPSGTWTLHVGLNPPGRNQARNGWNCARMWVQELSIEAIEGALQLSDLGGQREEFERLARELCGGKRSVLEQMTRLASDRTRTGVRSTGIYGLALAAQGPDAEQRIASQFAFLWQNSQKGSWFPKRWRHDLFLYSDAALRALVKVFKGARARQGLSLSPQVLPGYATRIYRTDPAQSILAYLACGPALRRPHLVLGISWLYVGGFAQSLEQLVPIERRRPGTTKGLAGLAAYRAGRMALAVEMWRTDADLYEALVPHARELAQAAQGN